MDIELHVTPRNGDGKWSVEAQCGDKCHQDQINIKSDTSRSRFIKRCGNRFGIDPRQLDGLHDAIMSQADDADSDADHIEDGIAAAKSDSDALLAAMPESIRAAAREMLNSEALADRIIADIHALGVAGESKLALTVYATGVSRMLAKPVAVIVQGPTSSGKSFVIDTTAQLFPRETVIHATQMTPQALFHMKPGSLSHRFVVAGERSRVENDDTAEATRALREMLSSGKLTKLIPIKDGGEIKTVTIEQLGPIAYAESTTLSEIFEEDANRAILLTTDEQAKQTRKILTEMAARYAGVTKVDSQHIIAKHHAIQRMLKPYTVVVPFAERLAAAISHDRVEARRAFPQLLSMVQAIALMHQYQRQVDQYGRLVADPMDYAVGRMLLVESMARSLGGRISAPARRFHKHLKEWFGETDFTNKEAAEKSSASRRSCYGYLDELHDRGLISLVQENKGRTPSIWRIAKRQIDDADAILPPVERIS